MVIGTLFAVVPLLASANVDAEVMRAPSPPATASAQPPVIDGETDALRIDEPDEIVVTARRRSTPGDPLKPANVAAFNATQKLDHAIVGPVALAYRDGVPGPMRAGLRNILYNLHEPDVALNFLLQHKVGKAAETLGRFVVNSTLGAAGLFDIAKRRPFALPRRPNAFADTFGFYGIKTGPFLYLPLIGPTTPRDLIGGMTDRFVLPVAAGAPFTKPGFAVPAAVVSTLDHRAEFDETLRQLHDDRDDAYSASREFYLRRRQAEIDHLRGADAQASSGKSAEGAGETSPPDFPSDLRCPSYSCRAR